MPMPKRHITAKCFFIVGELVTPFERDRPKSSNNPEGKTSRKGRSERGRVRVRVRVRASVRVGVGVSVRKRGHKKRVSVRRGVFRSHTHAHPVVVLRTGIEPVLPE